MAPYLNRARATYLGGVLELDSALQLVHPPDKDLEVGESTVFMEGADEVPNRPPRGSPRHHLTTPGGPGP